MRTLLLVSLLATILAPSPVFAQISDRELFERVAEAIRTYPHYTMFDSIEIGIDNRVVTLGGRVTAPVKKDEIEKRVRKIDGIRNLVDEIGVLPVSQTDNDIRYRVASAIYNHPMFWIYAQQ